MPISEPFELDGVTVGASELSILSGTTLLQTSTAQGVYQLLIDAFTMDKGDEFIIRIYETVEGTGGTKRILFSSTLADTQSEIWCSPMMLLKNGWDMTLQKIAGTDRAFDASVRAVV